MLSRDIAALGIFPAVDPLDSTAARSGPTGHWSRALRSTPLGSGHAAALYKELRDIIAILGMDELAPEDKLAVAAPAKSQRFLSQPFPRPEGVHWFTRQIRVAQETIRGFNMIVSGECDHLPEQAFYMVARSKKAFEKRENA